MELESDLRGAEYNPITEQELQEALRHLRNHSRLAQVQCCPVNLINEQLSLHPEWTSPQALHAVLDQVLTHLAEEHPLAADLLRGRYWEGLTVDEMLQAERPQQQSQRRFYLQQKDAIQLFTRALNMLEQRAHQAIRSAGLLDGLPTASYEALFGVEHLAAHVQQALNDPQTYIVSIEGIGGIGKTTLADYTVRQLVQNDADWAGLIWISAKQEYISPLGITRVAAAARLEELFSELAFKLGIPEALRLPLAQKVESIAPPLKQKPHLIVIDNLETLEDFEQLLPWLMRLAEPTRFLLTSRQAVRALSGVRVLPLQELDRETSMALINHCARDKQLSDIDAERVYHMVGGNPLAIQLVVSQMQYLPPNIVLDAVRLGTVEEMYTFIYRNAWIALDDQNAREVLLSIQRAGDQADWTWLEMMLDLSASALQDALARLLDLSLVQVRWNEPHRRVYAIHRLTSSFLGTEVLGWK